MSRSRTLLIFLAVWLASAQGFANPCALPEGLGGSGRGAGSEGLGGSGRAGGSEGLGGSGRATGGEGIGGSGQLPEGGEGLGGSGRSARGIIGIVTGFGSVCVNGIEVHYDRRTEVEQDGVRVSASKLAVGQLVRVEADEQGGRVQARKIGVRSAVIGPISALTSSGAVVLGQNVRIGPRSRVADAKGRPLQDTSLRVGTRVAVNGLRDSTGTIEAFHVGRSPAAGGLVRGAVERANRRSLRVAGVDVQLGPGEVAPAVGSRVVVRGEVAPSGVVRAAVASDRSEFSPRVSRATVQGFALPSGRGGSASSVRVQGFEVDLSGVSRADRARIQQARPVRVSGTVRGDRLRAEHVNMSDVLTRRESVPRGDRRDRGDREDREDREDRDDRDDREDRGERSGRGDRTDRSERPERADRPERAERPERPERPERAERPERPERSDRD